MDVIWESPVGNRNSKYKGTWRSQETSRPQHLNQGVWLHNTGTNTYPQISDC